MELTVKEWRRLRGISQAKFASALGVSLTTLQKWESHRAKLPVDKAFEMCNILNVKIDDVIFLPKDATKCSKT